MRFGYTTSSVCCIMTTKHKGSQMAQYNMFLQMLASTTDALYRHALATSAEMAEAWIRTLFSSVPELTGAQETKLHRLGRKVRRRFRRKPMRM